MAWGGLVADFLQVPAVTRAYTAACMPTTAAMVSRAGGLVVAMVTARGGRVFVVTTGAGGSPSLQPGAGVAVVTALDGGRLGYAGSRAAPDAPLAAPPLHLPPRLARPRLTARTSQVWRLVTTFLFFGPLRFSFFFHMLFVYPPRADRAGARRGQAARREAPGAGKLRPGPVALPIQTPRFRYCRMLEEGLRLHVSLRGRPHDRIAVGHISYFLEDVFPNQPVGKRLLLTPRF
ncbi:hypothetical protein HPG69_016525, partial [Diceros bicornis minor]